MIRVFVEGIGLAGPGLDGWLAARPVLAGIEPYQPREFVLQPIALLPPAERRRAGLVVKLAIGVGIEALGHAGRDAAAMATVFTSSGGDGETIHETLSVLATDQREVSPTRFHNSVHNAPSGYWAVATGSREPSTSLSAFDASFVAGLLDAASQSKVDDRPVTLIAYDAPYPEPLHSVRPISGIFGMALVLTPRPTERTAAALSLRVRGIGEPGPPATAMVDPALERLRAGNPAARGLPLLAQIARGQAGMVHLETGTGSFVEIGVAPA